MIDLILDDCMNVMSKYDDNYFDLAIVDPPYGLGYKDWDIAPKKEYFDELFRVSKNQIIWGGNFFGDFLGATTCPIIWDKENGKTYASDGEMAWCSFKKNQLRIYKQFWWSNMMKKEEKPIIHPTQKPIKLYDWILQNYAEKGQKILDTHLGSGSIAIACHYFGVDLVGVEIDKEYYDKAKERIDLLTKQESLF